MFESEFRYVALLGNRYSQKDQSLLPAKAGSQRVGRLAAFLIIRLRIFGRRGGLGFKINTGIS